MSALSQTIEISPRNRHFELKHATSLAWNGSIARTVAFNAMSVTFPEGERFFMDSVRAVRDRVADPGLQAQVRGFITQEAIHTREHVLYNQALEMAGIDLTPLNARHDAEFAESRARLTREQQLAVTCGLEHLTAILADAVLSEPAYFETADPKYRAIWLWHAVEEAEHKSVAFDVFNIVVPERGRYRMRSVFMLLAFGRFMRHLHLDMYSMLRDLGLHRSPRVWLGVLNFLWGRPGLFRRMMPALLGYFRPGFHPWDHDNRAKIEATERKLAAA